MFEEVDSTHYKRHLPRLAQEEEKLQQILERQHSEHVDSIRAKLSVRTEKVTEMYKISRNRKYDRDGIRPDQDDFTVVTPSVEEGNIFKPINLTDENIDSHLVHLCSRGPSFVPTPTAVDWNKL